MKKEIINDQYVYVTDKSFTFSLDDDKRRQFGVMFEVTNMYDATGEKEFKQYPFIVSAQIVADKVHKSFNESEDLKPNKLNLLLDAIGYMGGVPIDHILTHVIGSTYKNDFFKELCNDFKVNEATVITSNHDYGTIAAQHGKGTQFEYMQFKNEEAAMKFVDLLIVKRVSALSMMVGFILDLPINMIGDSGWSVMSNMVKGCK